MQWAVLECRSLRRAWAMSVDLQQIQGGQQILIARDLIGNR